MVKAGSAEVPARYTSEGMRRGSWGDLLHVVVIWIVAGGASALFLWMDRGGTQVNAGRLIAFVMFICPLLTIGALISFAERTIGYRRRWTSLSVLGHLFEAQLLSRRSKQRLQRPAAERPKESP